MITIIFIALGLAMDAFAVSITSGLTIKQLQIKHALRIAIFFGFFQAFMPLIGWSIGLSLRGFISKVDHWVVFGFLSAIGCKMIYESFKIESSRKKVDPLNLPVLLILSIATSVDALAVGMSFAFLKVSIITPIAVIGFVTFSLSLIGVFIGDRFGYFLKNKAEIIGGLILIGIGLKILFEHLAGKGV